MTGIWLTPVAYENQMHWDYLDLGSHIALLIHALALVVQLLPLVLVVQPLLDKVSIISIAHYLVLLFVFILQTERA